MTSNKILASLALVLAILAAFIGSPFRNDMDVNTIATMIETEQDHVTPLEVAEQLYAGKKIRLIDLRDSSSFAQQHIFNSENLSIQQVVNGGIKRNEHIVLYSEGGIHASQSWILLKLKHFDSFYTLLGGFAGWKEEILYPTLKAEATSEEKEKLERRKMLSLFFGGEPKIISRDISKRKAVRQKKSLQEQNPPVQLKEEDKLRYQC